MDNIPHLGTAADLDLRAARIADPGIGMLAGAILCHSNSMPGRPQNKTYSSMRTQRNDRYCS